MIVAVAVNLLRRGLRAVSVFIRHALPRPAAALPRCANPRDVTAEWLHGATALATALHENKGWQGQWARPGAGPFLCE